MSAYPDEGSDEFPVWPAFVDLLAATSLLFVVFVAIFLLLASRAEADADAERQALRTTLAHLDSALRDGQEQGSYEVINDGQFIRIILQADATFDRGQFDWYSLRPAGRNALSEIGRVLNHPGIKGFYRQARVIGHADATPYPGDAFTNWELSASRAAVVARFLVNEAEVNPCLISASGVSSHFPIEVADNSIPTEERHRRNRRIELEIIPVRTAAANSDSLQVREMHPGCDPVGDGTSPHSSR